ncbi:WD repeat-containing and planar cell polarity effector protein fritz homolog isoform X1 [Anguilla anguilla]|uniref:WD repeat-containing and planar cell polarity effector protein fritz homolog isoform X1 n=1 Tax=Anguilla anguilla TaxID=7936 RepID=UPI0015A87CDD|nr:WD repeat-containing and planar cell polarity effector protein fritz homolog isoform X1 [Anguilla anguilla]
MSFCLAELHLWSSKSSLHVRDTDIGTHQYYDKGEPVNLADHHYFNEKQHFAETRGLCWTPKNSRPEKLRDSLKELEELLQVSMCVGCRWRNTRSCQMLLSSGVLVTLGQSGAQLERVCVDRALVGRLAADTISDAVITDRFLLLSFVEKNKVSLVHLTKRSQSSPDLNRRVDKLSFSDLKISSVDLPGPAGRRLGLRVGLNRSQDVAVCWWPAVNEEAWPWSPVPSEGDRANLVLLGCGGAGGLKVLSQIRTEGDPLDCRFSLSQPYQILTVELGAGESTADSCVYECARGRPQRLSVTSVPLSSRPASCCRDPSESKLLLGLRDSSLVLYDARRGVTLLAQAPMLPSFAAWHPGGALLAVGDGQGELQCFDAGLSPVRVQLLAEEAAPGPTLQLSRHLRAPGGLAGLHWAAPPHGGEGAEVHDLLILAYHGGPIGALRFRLGALTGGQVGPAELVQERLRCGQAEEAVGLLGAMDWSTMGAECYRALAAIADHLLRQELDEDREAQLEAALGMFYAPSRPLSDMVVLEYRDAISKYARRFFHHLLRYQRFEKAFLLAVDVGARDLFMDIHYVARDKGELVLAEVAKKRANEIDAESLTTGLAGEQEWGTARDSTVPDRQTTRRRDSQLGRKTQVLPGEGRGRDLSHTQSQDSLSSRAASRGQQTRGLDEVFSGAMAGDETWDWAQAEFNIDASEDQVTDDPGTLKVVHFGLV